MKCWRCRNDMEYPWTEERGRLFCSHTCQKDWRQYVTHPDSGGSATAQVAPVDTGPAQASLFPTVWATDAVWEHQR